MTPDGLGSAGARLPIAKAAPRASAAFAQTGQIGSASEVIDQFGYITPVNAKGVQCLLLTGSGCDIVKPPSENDTRPHGWPNQLGVFASLSKNRATT